MINEKWIKYVFAFLSICLLCIRLFLFDKTAPDKLDSTILILFIFSAFILIIPWDRLNLFKAGGIEVQLNEPQVKGALSGMLDAQEKDIKELLINLSSKISQSKGGRILWLDDKPHNIIGERRFFRSLGIEVVTATPNTIMKILDQDNDFDLIISDIQWFDENEQPTYGGMEKIKAIRDKYNDPIIRTLPVIFYTAYTPNVAVEIMKEVGLERYLKIEICHSIETLVKQAILTISESRSNPIKVGKKKPT
jgi:CheY-like chemotaxis protein